MLFWFIFENSAVNDNWDPFSLIWLFLEGHWTQTIWPEGRCFQFWNSSLGAFNRRSELLSWQAMGLLLCHLFPFCLKRWLVFYRSYLIVYTIFCYQLPYSCLTPLQAAVGVVQKVYILLPFTSNFIVNNVLSMHDDSMWLKLLLGPTAYNSQKYTPKTFWTASAVLATRSHTETRFLWNNRNSSADSKRGKLILKFKNQHKVGTIKQFSVSFFYPRSMITRISHPTAFSQLLDGSIIDVDIRGSHDSIAFLSCIVVVWPRSIELVVSTLEKRFRCIVLLP